MDAAFLLIIRKGTGPGQANAAHPQPTADLLGFDATDDLTWSAAEGRTTLQVWSGSLPDRGHGRAHACSDQRATVVVGDLLPPAEAPQRERWASWVADLAASQSAEEIQDSVRGIFAAVHLDRSGHGWVIADPLGFRLFYIGEDHDQVVISSRAALVAQAMAPAGGHAHRDAIGAAWLAFTSYRIGDRTGYETVRVVGPSVRLRLEPGNVIRKSDSLIGSMEQQRGTRPISDLADEVIDDVASTLRAVLAEPADRHVINLTGGKDSRLILAIALVAGLAHQFAYETHGYPGLPDADVASELAAEFGLKHTVTFGAAPTTETFETRARQFSERTANMVSIWDLDAPRRERDIRVIGIGGEPLRSFVQLPNRRPAEVEVAAIFRRSQYDQIGVVRPEVADRLYAEVLQHLAEDPDPSCDPRVRMYAHFVHHRVRLLRLGPREELSGDRRANPLYSPVTIRAALTLPLEDLQAEVLFAEIMARGPAALVGHRFVGSGWSARALSHLESINARPADAPVATPTGPAGHQLGPRNVQALMAKVNTRPADGRLDLLEELFADRTSAAWDVFDRGVASDALARYQDLNTAQRRELFGVASGLLWLDSSGSNQPPLHTGPGQRAD